MPRPGQPTTGNRMPIPQAEEPKAFDIILEGGEYDGTRMRVSSDVNVVRKELHQHIKDGETDAVHRRLLKYYRTDRLKKDDAEEERLVYEARGHEPDLGDEPDPELVRAIQGAQANADRVKRLEDALKAKGIDPSTV